ncbi:MAG: hypothetical protein ACLFTR_05420, partial [Candidatus Woesearchaeota archaeon]
MLRRRSRCFSEPLKLEFLGLVPEGIKYRIVNKENAALPRSNERISINDYDFLVVDVTYDTITIGQPIRKEDN